MTPSPVPSISLIVPTFNGATYIGDCLQHVVAQMQADHELVIVDDGSTDATLDIVRAVQAAHPQLTIRLVEQPNQGISQARNTGLQQARGDYIAFVDSDDRLLDGALAMLDRVIASQRPDVIATAFRMWHPDAPAKDRDVYMDYPVGEVITSQDQMLNPFFRDRHMYVWCKVCRRDIYSQLEMPLFPPQRLFEDVAVVPRLLQRCRSMVYVPQVLLAYRQHPVSITRVISEQWCLDFASALASVKPHFEQGGASAAIRAHFDVAATHFYIGVVKNSYQLPDSTGRSVRQRVRDIFLGGLFNPAPQVLASMEGQSGAALLSSDRRGDAHTARQARMALRGSWRFHLEQQVTRKIKLWQRMQRTRALQRS
ncbi:MAG: glycosyltransferase family 2 protein [Sphingomonadaceae bacterium]